MKELEEIYREFEKKLGKVAHQVIDSAMSEVVTEYIPHAETDKISNVEHHTAEWLEKFFDGNHNIALSPMLRRFSCKEAREKVYQEHKEEIIALIGQDKDEVIDRLRGDLETARGPF